MRSVRCLAWAACSVLAVCEVGCCAAPGPRRQIGPPPPDAGIDAASRPLDASARFDAPSDAAFADGADADLRPMDASPMDARPEDAHSVNTDPRDTNELDAG
jgi:hypothetical protein